VVAVDRPDRIDRRLNRGRSEAVSDQGIDESPEIVGRDFVKGLRPEGRVDRPA
jgi:hypothetical protein